MINKHQNHLYLCTGIELYIVRFVSLLEESRRNSIRFLYSNWNVEFWWEVINILLIISKKNKLYHSILGRIFLFWWCRWWKALFGWGMTLSLFYLLSLFFGIYSLWLYLGVKWMGAWLVLPYVVFSILYNLFAASDSLRLSITCTFFLLFATLSVSFLAKSRTYCLCSSSYCIDFYDWFTIL